MASDRQTSRRHGVIAFALVGLVAGMTAMAFAAVPLYRMFCQVTGYGGTTQRAEKPSDTVLERTITVRFDSNVARGLPWEFRPAAGTLEVRIGESSLAFYKARNLSARPVKGTATFNVTPEIAGIYFNKIHCFCFEEQLLKPGEAMDMPVTFFIDPAIMKDPDAKNVTSITLSYTFFPVVEKPLAQIGGKGAGAKEKGS